MAPKPCRHPESENCSIPARSTKPYVERCVLQETSIFLWRPLPFGPPNLLDPISLLRPRRCFAARPECGTISIVRLAQISRPDVPQDIAKKTRPRSANCCFPAYSFHRNEDATTPSDLTTGACSRPQSIANYLCFRRKKLQSVQRTRERAIRKYFRRQKSGVYGKLLHITPFSVPLPFLSY